MLKQKRVDCVVVSSKLHVSGRSTAPYIVSTSQPPADRTTLVTRSQHFGPSLGILLRSRDTKRFAVPTLPTGTVLIRPISQSLDPANPRFKFLSAKCTRRGLPVVPAFALTDYKAQGKTFEEVVLELRGHNMVNGEPSKCYFTNLYVQLSRCTTLRGVKLLSPVRH
jgi:hypothetical protein